MASRLLSLSSTGDRSYRVLVGGGSSRRLDALGRYDTVGDRSVGDRYIRISKGKFSLLPMIGLISDLYRIKRSGRRNKNRNRLDLLAQHE